MESNLLSSLVGILRESHVLFLKNWNLMAPISLLILLLQSFLVLCNFFSIKPLLKDFILKEALLFLTNPGSSQYANIVLAMTANLRTFAGLEWFFILALSMASLFSSTTTILAAAVTYGEVNLSLKDLLLRILKSWKRPIITWFYITLCDIGYVIFIFFSILPFAMYFGTPSHPSAFVYAITAVVSTFRMYLAVFWDMSIVISVLEEKSGLEALGKASQLLKGMKLKGFLLELMFGVIALIVYISWNMVDKKSETYYWLFMGLLLLNIICLIKMSASMAFTVFYHVCKQSQGQEIELQGSSEYTKVSNQQLIGADMA